MNGFKWTTLLAGSVLSVTVAFAADSFDSDDDGFDDNSDNCTLVANPDQRDTNGDGFGNLCDPDLNNNDIVDAPDAVRMRRQLGAQGKDLDADLDGNGVVLLGDVNILRESFGGKPGPSGATPDTPACNCYFSGDCVGVNQFCDWGPGGFTVEDICWWREPKPTEPGNGCSTEYEGPFIALCDGICSADFLGSSVGHEDTEMLVAAARAWTSAMLEPSRRGGGPVDELFASQARAVPFASPYSAEIIGRNAADLLGVASSSDFYDYFCHYEHHPDELGDFVNLEGDACRIGAARVAMEALTTEMLSPGTGASKVQAIANLCPGWQEMFAPRCPAGPEALNCMQELVASMARFLTTPREAAQAGSILDLM